MLRRMLREAPGSIVRALYTGYVPGDYRGQRTPCDMLADVEMVSRNRKLWVGGRLERMARRWHGAKYDALDEAIRLRAKRELQRRGKRL